jgi:hypothetical protein
MVWHGGSANSYPNVIMDLLGILTGYDSDVRNAQEGSMAPLTGLREVAETVGIT